MKLFYILNATKGHYFAWVRQKGQTWFKWNDETGTEVTWNEVQKRQAYILIWEMIDEENPELTCEKRASTDDKEGTFKSKIHDTLQKANKLRRRKWSLTTSGKRRRHALERTILNDLPKGDSSRPDKKQKKESREEESTKPTVKTGKRLREESKKKS